MSTQGRWSRFGAVIAVGLLGGLLFVPAVIAHAQEGGERTAEDVEMGDENWFFRFRNVPRELPGDLQEGPAGPALGTARGETNLYDHWPPGNTGETLHVGVIAGQPEARMFLAMPTLDLLTQDDGFGDVIVTGGEITLTDAGVEHGSRAVQTADIIACPATEAVFGGRGGDWADMPGFDCATHVPVEPVEGSDPAQFTIDLDPLAGAFADNPDAQVVALVERLVLDAGEEEPRAAEPQSWHLAVHSNLTCFDDGGGDTPGEDDLEVDGQACVEGRPVTADLTYRVETLDVDFDLGGEDLGELDDVGDFEDAGDLDDAAFEEGFDDGFAGDVPAEDVALDDGFSDGLDEGGEAFADDAAAGEELADDGDMAEAAPGGAAVQPQAAGPDTEERGMRTPRSFFLLPLLGLGLAGMLGYSLTRPPELPAAREGAVSALMRRRRLEDGSPPA